MVIEATLVGVLVVLGDMAFVSWGASTLPTHSVILGRGSPEVLFMLQIPLAPNTFAVLADFGNE